MALQKHLHWFDMNMTNYNYVINAVAVIESAMTQALGAGLFKRFEDADAVRQAVDVIKELVKKTEGVGVVEKEYSGADVSR